MQRGFLELADLWISRATDDRGIAWFRGALDEIGRPGNDRALGIAIGLAPRRLGKASLALGGEDLSRAAALRKGLDPSNWTVDQLARIALMVASYRDDVSFAETLNRFCVTAEINELIAVYRGLPVYPAAKLIEPRAREAVRSGMQPVFEAVAHHNPYPCEVFAEDDWNQMVVKAIFIGASLWRIQGLDQRCNPNLARMLVALAHERRAASRPISPEVWRCIAPYLNAESIGAMTHAWGAGVENDRFAIALALQSAPETDAGLPFRDQMREMQDTLGTLNIDWPNLG
ncbi:EboA domain-containing protein [Mesorhizobium sp. M0664]|uniref:EboA domain-containing protein n=1 Tax=Mesorhizobium sp. M0664 TaxID=2956982 RepID=UPI003337B423